MLAAVARDVTNLVVAEFDTTAVRRQLNNPLVELGDSSAARLISAVVW